MDLEVRVPKHKSHPLDRTTGPVVSPRRQRVQHMYLLHIQGPQGRLVYE